jgi:hypothetical protein
VLGHLDHDADHAEGGEVDERPDQRRLGEPARAGVDRDHRAHGHTGNLRLVTHRGVGVDLLPGFQHGVRVEQGEAQGGRPGHGLARPGDGADLAAAFQLHADQRGRVVG